MTWWQRVAIWLDLMWAPTCGVASRESALGPQSDPPASAPASLPEPFDYLSESLKEDMMAKRKTTKKAAKPKLRPRRWIHVVARGTGKGREWVVLENTHAKGQRGTIIETAHTRAEALAFARSRGKGLWAGGTPAQVVIHGTTGRIKADATYGADPKSSRG